MHYKIISKILGKYLFYFSLILIIPFGVALYFQFLVPPDKHFQPHSSLAFLETILITLALSFLFSFIGRKETKSLRRKEAIFLVPMIWIITAFIGGLPFYLSKTLENPVDAYFESMSGFTTTGASVMQAKKYDPVTKQEIKIHLQNAHIPEKTYKYYGTIKPAKNPKTKEVITGIPAVGKGILFWRSFIQWLGGMGIVVLFLAILPALTVGGKFLYQMEVPGPTKDVLVPRIKETASILWKIYLGCTILQIYLLIWTNSKMKLFDAFCITFSTLATGGFTVTNQSIGSYNNIHTEWVIILFMLIGSTNFALYFQLIKRKLYQIYEPDYRFFVLFTLSSAFILSLFLIGQKQFALNGTISTYNISSAIREGFFQSISAQTCTGFYTTNYDMWPFFPQLAMLMLMFVGGMAGSTTGGIKTSRIYILLKIIPYKIKSIFRPDDVKTLKVGKQKVPQKTAVTVLTFFTLVVLFTIVGVFLITLNGVDPESSLAVVVCMFNTVGMAFRAAGPIGSFTFLPIFSKIVSIFLMLFGRLEIFALLLFFVPSFWKKEG